MKAIRYHTPGGPEVLRIDELPTPEPQAGEVRIALRAAGVNFIDVYLRNGLYPSALPAIAGKEGAGVVDAVGPGVDDVAAGDRVAFFDAQGSYAEAVVLRADRVIPRASPSRPAADLAAPARQELPRRSRTRPRRTLDHVFVSHVMSNT